MSQKNNYISAQDLWQFIEYQRQRIEILADDDLAQSSSSYRLLLIGRLEQLDALAQFVYSEQTPLEDILKVFEMYEEEKATGVGTTCD